MLSFIETYPGESLILLTALVWAIQGCVASIRYRTWKALALAMGLWLAIFLLGVVIVVLYQSFLGG